MTSKSPTPASAPTPAAGHTRAPIAADPQGTLDAAIAAAIAASPVFTGRDGGLHIALPATHRLHPLPDDTALPARPRARITLDDRDSLVAYARRHASDASCLLADYDKGTVCARLDWHPHNQGPAHGTAGADEHSATLVLRPAEEFARWNAMAGKLHEQDAFARFLEENAGDVDHPDAATMIEISRDFEATVGQVYKSSVNLANGDRRLMFESETKAQHGIVVPRQFTLAIPVWNGEPPDTLTALFRWRARPDGGVMLGFEWHRLEYRRRAHFVQIATAVAEATGLPVYYGRTA